MHIPTPPADEQILFKLQYATKQKSLEARLERYKEAKDKLLDEIRSVTY
jgi:hypothetical protein